MEDYVENISELYDQITAYEPNPDPELYVIRFIDGLKPSVRLPIALQQPVDLDSAYELALLHASLTDASLVLPFFSRSQRERKRRQHRRSVAPELWEKGDGSCRQHPYV